MGKPKLLFGFWGEGVTTHPCKDGVQEARWGLTCGGFSEGEEASRGVNCGPRRLKQGHLHLLTFF